MRNCCKQIKAFFPGFLLFFVFLVQAHAARVDSFSIFSRNMLKYIPVKVLVPDAYDSLGKAVPTLYLLHGYGGDYGSWIRNDTSLKYDCDAYQMIFVCPDGGFDSWYLDDVRNAIQYETFIYFELVLHIDSMYHTLREKRAICGVSMGGQGALRIALRHPSVFSMAISISGVVDLRASKISEHIAEKFGKDRSDVATLMRLSVINMIDQYPPEKVELILTCGRDDYLLPSNLAFNKKLEQMGYKSQFMTFKGGHNWLTFNESFAAVIGFISDYLYGQ